ncbi:MAG: exodeoxyribonuclease large subunit, partial [Frankiaceae bacterium]|nr:exodeoxyribonuclease large subunit [Frankiaceae bacterium]
AKRVVPNVGEQLALVAGLRDRAFRSVTHRLDAEQHRLDGLRHRPVLADPVREIDRRAEQVEALRVRGGRCLGAALDRAESGLEHSVARVRAMSPLATLQRGYAVVQHRDGPVVRDADEVTDGETLDVRVAAGRLQVSVTERTPEAAA